MKKLKELDAGRPPSPLRYPLFDAKITFDGVELELDDISEISWRRLPEPTYGFDVLRILHPDDSRTYEISAVCDVKIRPRVWRRFLRILARPRHVGASFATLMRRAGYGGRKGRRALRRLLAMSDHTWQQELS